MIFILSKEAVEKKLNIYKNFDEIVLKKVWMCFNNIK